MHNHKILPNLIRTPRLTMRPLSKDYRDVLYTSIIETMDLLTPWMPWADIYQKEGPRAAEEYLKNCEAEFKTGESFNFACFAGTDFVGVVGLVRPRQQDRSIEIGYWCVKSHQSRGYITEAANAIARFAFDVLCMKKVLIICDEQNFRSAAVAHRLGFTLEHVGLDTCGQARDCICERYAITGTRALPALSVSFEGELS